VKRILAVSLFCLILSGCYSEREFWLGPTPEEQQALSAAQNDLAGNYVVMDSRLDFLQIKSVTIMPHNRVRVRNRGPEFFFHLKNGGIAQLRGYDCMVDLRSTKNTCWPDYNLYWNRCSGSVGSPGNPEYRSVTCNGAFPAYDNSARTFEIGPSYDISFALINKPSQITNSKKLPPYSPMDVKSGDYTMSISIGPYDSYDPKKNVHAMRIIHPTTDGPARYVLKKVIPDKSEGSDLEQ